MSEVRATDLVIGPVDSGESYSCEIRASGSHEIRCANLPKANLALRYEIRSANLVKVNLAQLALRYEIRSANLVKAKLGKAEVGS